MFGNLEKGETRLENSNRGDRHEVATAPPSIFPIPLTKTKPVTLLASTLLSTKATFFVFVPVATGTHVNFVQP